MGRIAGVSTNVGVISFSALSSLHVRCTVRECPREVVGKRDVASSPWKSSQSTAGRHMSCGTSAYVTPPSSLQRLETRLIGFVLAKMRNITCPCRLLAPCGAWHACMTYELTTYSVISTGELLEKRRSAPVVRASESILGQLGQQGAFSSSDEEVRLPLPIICSRNFLHYPSLTFN